MATYYKYQNPSEIGAAPTLDWGTVISNVNQTLQNQEQQRYENREADKQLTNDILKKANEITASSDPNFGAIIQKTADQIKNNTFARYNLLKNNKISRSDYSIFKQNATASIAELDNFSKGWNKTYETALDLRRKGLTTEQANALQDVLGGFQNFKDKKLIQGDDGFIYTATIDPNTGKTLDNSLGILPMQALNNVKNYTDLSINLQDEANKYAKDMKPFITVVMKNGIRTLEAVNQKDNKNYAEFLDNAFNGVAVNDNVIGDILTKYGTYKVDLNKQDSDPAAKILTAKQKNGTFVSDITPQMREEAKAIFEKQLLSQVKYEETPRTEFAPDRGTSGGRGKKEEPVATVNDFKLAGGRTKGAGQTGVYSFTSQVPIVDNSTGVKRMLKALYFDTKNPNNIRAVITIQDKDDPTKVKDVSYSSFARTEKVETTTSSGKPGKPRAVQQQPDLTELNNWASKIYDPSLGRFLEDWTELRPYLLRQAPGSTPTAPVSKGTQQNLRTKYDY